MPIPASLDPDHDLGPFATGRKPDMPAILAVLGRVVQKVDDDLLKPGRIDIKPEIAAIDGDIEGVAALFDQGPGRKGGTVKDRCGLDDLTAKLKFARD